MHYTSIENIHKVIDPLFLNDLRAEFERICLTPQEKTRRKALDDLQDKIASLTFFDPACGSGNFLTESYVSLRRLENEIISVREHGQATIGDFANPIKVNIHQFYGIEINDFAVSVATTALWIAEEQMLQETAKIVSFALDPLPLKSYHNIHEGNALRLDWSSVFEDRASLLLADKKYPDYIMGNPPFVGARLMSSEQKDDLLNIFGKKWKYIGNIDYVAGWYLKTAEMMQKVASINPEYYSGSSIRAALVSTNSITQGEQVAALWKPLFEQYNIHFDFAYRTFRWDSEADIKAHVHCVIIGFSANTCSLLGATPPSKTIYLSDAHSIQAANINAYLMDAPDTWIESRSTPLCDVPEMVFGSMANDGGNLILNEEEKEAFVNKYPQIEPYIKSFLGAEEFINNKKRFCLWFDNCPPTILRSCPPVMERIENVRNLRAQSSRPGTRKMADYPMLFGENRQPDSNYLLVPRVSSERRRYIPLGFLDKEIIASDAVQIIPNASLYHFGVLTSNVHMAWMRAVCGRLETRYRYSANIVYNNFPWPSSISPELNSGMYARIETTAQAILDARAKYPDCSLADLYDEVTMPPELRRAHQENDRAVMAAYGFTPGKSTESDCVAALFKLYQQLT